MQSHMTTGPSKLTYEDYCAVPDDGYRYEVLDGVLSRRPKCTIRHQTALQEIAFPLHGYVRKHKLGEVFIAPLDVLLSRHDIVMPDVFFISEARKSIVTKPNIKGAPDLLVEVLMPESIERDSKIKRDIYARCGVIWYWIIDPEKQSVLELRLVENSYAVVSETKDPGPFSPELFPGYQIDLPELWKSDEATSGHY